MAYHPHEERVNKKTRGKKSGVLSLTDIQEGQAPKLKPEDQHAKTAQLFTSRAKKIQTQESARRAARLAPPTPAETALIESEKGRQRKK